MKRRTIVMATLAVGLMLLSGTGVIPSGVSLNVVPAAPDSEVGASLLVSV